MTALPAPRRTPGDRARVGNGERLIPGLDTEMFRVRPKRIISWGIDRDDYDAARTPLS